MWNIVRLLYSCFIFNICIRYLNYISIIQIRYCTVVFGPKYMAQKKHMQYRTDEQDDKSDISKKHII